MITRARAAALASGFALFLVASQGFAQQADAGQGGQVVATGATVPAPGLPVLPDLDKTAFEQIYNNGMPLSPEQIRDLRKRLDEAERATVAPPRSTPKPVSTAVTANLAPGTQPPVVRLADGYVTSVLFVDAVGNPLPITGTDLVKGVFEMPAVDPGSNVVKLSPKSPYAMGNISVNLKGVSTPVVLTLVSGQKEVDYRVDVRVTGGNLAARLAGTSSGGRGGSAYDTTMLEFLSGGMPEGAKPLRTDNADVQAWALGNRYYVRSPMTLLSPAYINPGKSSDGTSFYEIPPTAVVVVSAGGTPKHIRIEAP